MATYKPSRSNRLRGRAPRTPSIMSEAVRDPSGVYARADERRAGLPDIPLDGVPVVSEVQFAFDAPAQVVSQNQFESWHWADRAAHRAAWREAARIAADGAADALSVLRGYRTEVTVALPVSQPGRRRDPSNWVATCVKPILDGVTDSATVWPDDNGTWVEVREPVLWGGKNVVVRVAIASPKWEPTAE